jgi:hypothetical protein
MNHWNYEYEILREARLWTFVLINIESAVMNTIMISNFQLVSNKFTIHKFHLSNNSSAELIYENSGQNVEG